MFDLHRKFPELDWVCVRCQEIITEHLKQNGSLHVAEEKTAQTEVKPALPVQDSPETVDDKPASEAESLSEAVSSGEDESDSQVTVIEVAKKSVKRRKRRPRKTTTNPALKQTEASTYLKDRIDIQAMRIEGLAEEVRRMAKDMKQVNNLCTVATGRQRNIVVYGVPEPVSKSVAQRVRGMKYYLTNILRVASLPGHTETKRVFRLGRWKGSSEGQGASRPMLVEFAHQKDRDALLRAADTVRSATNGTMTICPDYAVGNTSRASLPSAKRKPRYSCPTNGNASARVRLERLDPLFWGPKSPISHGNADNRANTATPIARMGISTYNGKGKTGTESRGKVKPTGSFLTKSKNDKQPRE
ncbi:MAG: hypothetical protein ABW094_18050 [Candidatus Thiodiazotropha sp.]